MVLSQAVGVMVLLVVIGGYLVVRASEAAAVVGDLNGDGIVNVFDLSILLSKWNTADATADLNHDGTVNIFDLSALLSHWGQTGSTPTPTPTPTNTPTPTSTATATPSALSVQTCVQPSIMNGQTLGGDAATLYGLTFPGATCTGRVLYLDGNVPPDFNDAGQTVGSSGVVMYPWSENTTAGGGLARVSCQLGDQFAASCTGFPRATAESKAIRLAATSAVSDSRSDGTPSSSSLWLGGGPLIAIMV